MSDAECARIHEGLFKAYLVLWVLNTVDPRVWEGELFGSWKLGRAFRDMREMKSVTRNLGSANLGCRPHAEGKTVKVVRSLVICREIGNE